MRDAGRTRRTVLDAAARTVAVKGTAVSLDAVAKAAGVSKSGLLHHFPSRDELFLALAQDLAEQFVAAVQAAVDPRDHAAGRLVRGYINATFNEIAHGVSAPEQVMLAGALSSVPGVDRVLREHTDRWEKAFEADGLHPDRVLLIIRAADGATVAAIYEGGANPEELQHTRELLLRLSHGEGGL
ncbi:TetR/AcrR family transcriptional regulator [Actinoplanes sp. TRM 88003]|uniref:TetR/AcrR family transcriptional regulator n=1 Tax=Paractinoplanes aksuensis TaxID=2939490 RepID=A0ABT1E0W5_9ACTN|nr:TetR/AcrR family transcriptional regulator [Actinoplanes aksuensis]MCO8276728.1 TetR/AcrR family transcriptional regulator [Actinoplanes aksuensis]